MSEFGLVALLVFLFALGMWAFNREWQRQHQERMERLRLRLAEEERKRTEIFERALMAAKEEL